MPETGVTSQGIVDEANSKMRRHMRAKKLAYKACVEINPAHPEDVPALIPAFVRVVRRAANTPPEDGHAYTENCGCLRCSAAFVLARLDTKKEDGDGR